MAKAAPSPDELLWRRVPIEGVALLEACSPVLLPPQDKIHLIELRRKVPADTALAGAELLRDYDFELRELLLTLTDRRLYPRAPAVANSDGDPLKFHTLHFELPDPAGAAVKLRDLAAGVEDDDFEAGIERDASGHILRAEFPWLRIGAVDSAAMQNTVLGQLRIEAGRLTAEVNSARRATALRRMIEQRLPEARVLPSVVQSSERLIGQAHERAMAGTPLPRNAELERLQQLPEVQEALRETLRRHYRSWPDEQLPALGGRTPREAVKDPDGREAVEALLRQFERDMTQHDQATDAGIVAELRTALGLNWRPARLRRSPMFSARLPFLQLKKRNFGGILPEFRRTNGGVLQEALRPSADQRSKATPG